MQGYRDWVRHRSCERKTGRWESQLDANRAALKIWQTGQFLHSYRCDHCGMWHLTSKRMET